MILTKQRILHDIQIGRIEIDPFVKENVQPTSVDLRIHPQMYKAADYILDMKKKPDLREITIPNDGLVLNPSQLYLARTVERVHTDYYVTQITGKSSIGRLGVQVHMTAAFAEPGFNGTWTLEISVVKPVRIYPNVRFCQVYFSEISGNVDLYEGHYQNQVDATASKAHEWLKKEQL